MQCLLKGTISVEKSGGTAEQGRVPPLRQVVARPGMLDHS